MLLLLVWPYFEWNWCGLANSRSNWHMIFLSHSLAAFAINPCWKRRGASWESMEPPVMYSESRVDVEVRAVYWVETVFHLWSKQHEGQQWQKLVETNCVSRFRKDVTRIWIDREGQDFSVEIKQGLNFYSENANHTFNGAAQWCCFKSVKSS